ncbi:hypothetical protein HPC49_33320 [Pyxidicoccus fallax]|uniref:HEAT repeat domain-containing protein n=1 Tax=Pyxidicoccus fallax TaxID=394095 RepID=A0A848LQ82_9BACT|nr:hypothetical protein [Pyxidicoccus fallax]NMO19861.1 hypothetical protein [Pyxidicoccus fallax]NPC83089.1 hypothetical protein [Pyxidicoccus fallax]
MKTHVLFSSILCMALLLGAGKALALDIPPGGDALGHQLVASQSSVIAQLTSNDGTVMGFTTAVPLTGQVPTQFRLAHDTYTATERLVPGNHYLLFLSMDAAGALQLATSAYSIVAVDLQEAASYRTAIANYQQTWRDPQSFKRVALAQLDASVPYLRYSAMADLAYRGLFTADDGALLARLAASSTASQPEVRKLALGQIGGLRLVAYAEQLGAVLGNAAETTSIRLAALDGLRFMDRTDVIQRQAASVGDSPSPKLKARMLEALEPQPQ